MKKPIKRIEPWIGVDLDGTLAEWNGWESVQSAYEIGPPVPKMVRRVRKWLAKGKKVKIFTARVNPVEGEIPPRDIALVKMYITKWCAIHLGAILEVTNIKDQGMIELWDDRCIQVEHNTGRRIGRTGANRRLYK